MTVRVDGLTETQTEMREVTVIGTWRADDRPLDGMLEESSGDTAASVVQPVMTRAMSEFAAVKSIDGRSPGGGDECSTRDTAGGGLRTTVDTV